VEAHSTVSYRDGLVLWVVGDEEIRGLIVGFIMGEVHNIFKAGQAYGEGIVDIFSGVHGRSLLIGRASLNI